MGFRKNKTLMDQAGEIVDQILPAIESAVDTAKEKAGPLLNDARGHARDFAADARETAKPILAEIKGEPEQKKGSKLKKILVITGIAGLAGFAYKRLTASDDSWQTAYTPAPPPPRPAASPAPAAGPAAGPVVDDAAASSPDEALADAVEEPHEVTTPDDPAEVVEVDEEGSHKA